MTYTQHYSKKLTPQNQPIPGEKMVKMRSGGYAFQVGDWEQLRRFLILGTVGGTFYASEQEMTKECAEVIERCLDQDGIKTVSMIVEVSDQGLALKNDHALFALAIAAGHKNKETRTYALNCLTKVARTATHLFMFLSFVQHFRGWGRSLQTAVSYWYSRGVDQLAYQIIKYRQREGWTHRDVLRKARPTPITEDHNRLFKWVTQGTVDERLPKQVLGFMMAQDAKSAKEVALLIGDYNLPREAVPTQYLNDPAVWTALLEHMPLTAMVRNLGVMTANGTLKPLNESVKLVCQRLRDENLIQNSRIHPIQILFALKTYAQGYGELGNKSWSPIQQIVDALDDAYYLAFDNLESTDQNIVMGIDISGSMKGNYGVMTPAEFAGAMAMVTLKTSTNCEVKGFDHRLHNMPLSPKMRLDEVCRIVSQMGGGMTSGNLPIEWAANNGIPVDAFILYSDGESWSGNQHVMQALNTYRKVMNRPNTKLVCVNFTPTAYALANPDDLLSLNIVGNSPDVASAITAFLNG